MKIILFIMYFGKLIGYCLCSIMFLVKLDNRAYCNSVGSLLRVNILDFYPVIFLNLVVRVSAHYYYINLLILKEKHMLFHNFYPSEI